MKELRVLNRIIQWTKQGIQYEADPRHMGILARDLEVTQTFITPGIKKVLKILKTTKRSPKVNKGGFVHAPPVQTIWPWIDQTLHLHPRRCAEECQVRGGVTWPH